MSDRVCHCPFLNRSDDRCSNHFSLDRLGKALEDCFGEYHSCPTYAELLIERQVRRAGDRVLVNRHATTSFVQLRLPIERNESAERYAKSIA